VSVLPAKRLLEPTYSHYPEYVETFGPEVADICARANYVPDLEQEFILNATFGIRADGKPSAFEVDIIGPRQNIKTSTIKMIEIGWLFVTKERLIVHSAHEMTTTEETFLETAALISDTPFLSRHLKPGRQERDGITTGANKWAIELLGNRRIRYKARTRTGARGLAARKLVLDEFFAVTPAMVGSIYPTMAAQPAPQIVSASSAGLLESDALRDKRNRGRLGLTANQFYMEHSDPLGPTSPGGYAGCAQPGCDHAKTAVGCALDDESRWARIMPALGGRVQVETIRNFRQTMPPEEFAREFLVWWEDPPLDEEARVFGPHWARQGIADAVVPTPLCLGLAVAPERKFSSLVAVGNYGSQGVSVVFPAMLDPLKGGHREGVTWLLDEAVAIAQKYGIRIAVAQYGPGADLVEPLQKRLGADRVLVADMSQLKDGCSGFYDGICESHDIFHNDSVEMNDAARSAVKRMSGGRFLWGWKEGDDVSMIEAATLAVWGAAQPLPRRSVPMASFV
jgi:hypothetical protein